MQISLQPLLALTGVSIFIGWVCLGTHFEQKRTEVLDEQTLKLATLRADAERERENRRAEYRRQLELAWGGPLAAVTKDPDIDIATMLRIVAQAYAPSRASVEVHVDRFTEFDVDIVLQAGLSKEQIALFTKRFLSTCGGQYVNSLRFLHERDIVAELDKRAIDHVPDWGSISLQAVEALF